MAAAQDYERFYNNEIKIRQAMLYPPFADICMVGFVSDNHISVLKSSNDFMKRLVDKAKASYSDIPLRVLGPSPASIAKVSNKYRFKLIVKCRNSRRFRKLLSETLLEYNSIKENKNTTAYIDMNALSF